MALSYFNRIVYYETLKVGTKEFLISNIVLEAIPLLSTFASASKKEFKSSSLINYFDGFFENLDEDSLYEYLERVVKIIHKVGQEDPSSLFWYIDNTFMYFMCLLHIPREVLIHIRDPLFDILNKLYPFSNQIDELSIDKIIKLLQFYLEEESTNIEESIKYYYHLIGIISDGYLEDEDIKLYDKVLKSLDEAAEIYLENGRCNLYFINYTMLGDWWGDITKYLGIVEINDPLPLYILHNYKIMCGDIFTIHNPMLEYLPEEMREELTNDKNSTYDCHLDKDRSNDMKFFLEEIYKHSIDNSGWSTRKESILLLIDLKLTYKYIRYVTPISTNRAMLVRKFVKETDLRKLRTYVYYHLGFEIDFTDDQILYTGEFTEGLWNIIKLFRKRKYNKEAIRLYKIMMGFMVNPTHQGIGYSNDIWRL